MKRLHAPLSFIHFAAPKVWQIKLAFLLPVPCFFETVVMMVQADQEAVVSHVVLPILLEF